MHIWWRLPLPHLPSWPWVVTAPCPFTGTNLYCLLNRDNWVWTTCPELFYSHLWLGFKPMTSWPQVQRHAVVPPCDPVKLLWCTFVAGSLYLCSYCHDARTWFCVVLLQLKGLLIEGRQQAGRRRMPKVKYNKVSTKADDVLPSPIHSESFKAFIY